MLANRCGMSNLITCVAVIGVIVAAAVTMREMVQRSIQARMATATVDMLRIPADTGDGVATQVFAEEATKKLTGFLDQPDTIAMSNTTANATNAEQYGGEAYQWDASSTNQVTSTQVTQELLPGSSSSTQSSTSTAQ